MKIFMSHSACTLNKIKDALELKMKNSIRACSLTTILLNLCFEFMCEHADMLQLYSHN